MPDHPDAASHLLPWVRRRLSRGDRVIGLHGSQASGKSTACAQLVAALATDGVRAVAISIDDVYRTRAERRVLGETVHPLLATRGVPGTHDVALALRTIQALREAGPDSVTPIPRFDKDTDDRTAPEHVEGAVDLVLFEGWCVGLPPVPDAELATPFNELERTRDADGAWRRFVVAQLEGPYAELWSAFDGLAALIAPDLATVVRWRTEAEAARRAGGAPGALHDVAAFVAHYARWTAWGIAQMPEVGDVTLWLDGQRRIVRTRGLPDDETSATR